MGAGANIIASVGPDGVLLVDAGTRGDDRQGRCRARAAPTRVVGSERAEAARLGAPRRDPRSPIVTSSRRPSRFATSSTPGPQPITSAATRSCATRDARSPAATSPAIFATQEKAPRSWRTRTCSTRLSHAAEGQPAPPADALPTDTYFTDYYKLSHFFNGEGVQLLHMPKAHTDGDSIVLLPRKRRDRARRPDVHRELSGHRRGEGRQHQRHHRRSERGARLAITEFRLEGGTMMVPGHGRLVDSGDVAYYRDMVTIIRDRVQDMVKQGDDARRGEGGEADRRLRHRVRQRRRAGRRTCSSKRSTRASAAGGRLRDPRERRRAGGGQR